ncbi:MAG: peptidase M14 family protein, partial [Gemmatimonadetes bacterium]|nr:peptidase M14 family protein [Gemmatimonadota bacterium]
MSRSRRARLPHVLLSLLGILLAPVLVSAQGADVPTPEAYFGFRMGTDNRLARWDRMVEYYRMLGEASDRMTVWEMGPTTLGNPFLALIVTAPANHARLDEYQRMNALLSDPRGASERQIEDAIATGKAVIVQSLCLHSTEVAAGQTAVELAYDLVTRDDDEMQRILDETIGIMIPCFNPDGQIMVADWVERTTGTEYEGTGLPFLYHHYIGHDNNRDAFMQNTVESRYGAQILFREWIPQAYVDHHQMGGYTARIYLPPYAEPIRPAGDPLVWREMAWYGAHMAYKMDEAGLEGAVNAAIYSGWGHFGFHWITPFHNIAGMLTESASPRMAAPLYVHPEQLGGSRQLPEYEAQTTFPSPWEGGWWRVRDIVDRQKVAYMATLDMAARNRETVLRNAWLKAARQTERGEEGSPAGFVIPAEQHDPLT